MSEVGRKRRATDRDYAYRVLRELSEAAEDSAVDPSYLSRNQGCSSSSVVPVISERQREKVVKYINEVRADVLLRA